MARKRLRFKDGETYVVTGNALLKFRRRKRKGKGRSAEVTVHTPAHVVVEKVLRRRD